MQSTVTSASTRRVTRSQTSKEQETQKVRVQHALEGGIRMLDRGKQIRACARPAVRECIQIPVWPKQILAFARFVLWDVTRPTAYGSPPGTFTKDIHRIAVAKRAPLAITRTREKGGMIAGTRL